jgi:hypothetical protein
MAELDDIRDGVSAPLSRARTPTGSACCPPDALAACCEPAANEACCAATTADAPSECGCQT